jgi:hypothetical protein
MRLPWLKVSLALTPGVLDFTTSKSIHLALTAGTPLVETNLDN